MKFKTKYIVFFLFFTLTVSAQKTVVSGRIIDTDTEEVLPYANVWFENTITGTISNAAGDFYLETNDSVNVLIISSVGYVLQKFNVDSIRGKTIVARLKKDVFAINEIVIKPDDSHLRNILKKISERKRENDTRNFSDWRCELYSKIEIDLKNINRRELNNNLLKQIEFIYDYLDTLETSGRTFLPVFITETVSDYFHYTDGDETEYIKATKISGMTDNTITQFTGKLYTEIFPYDNFIQIHDVHLVSPLNDNGTLYYKYYLRDSAIVDNQKIYEISFFPRRTQTPTFKGKMWIADNTFALTKIEMRLSETANINFMKEAVYEKEYKRLNDRYIPEKESFWCDLNLQKKENELLGLIGRKSIIYSNFEFVEKIEMPEKSKKDIVIASNAMDYDSQYWNSVRPMELNEREAAIYTMIDSLRNVPIVRTVENIAEILMYGYVNLGKIEFGPYYYLYSSNKIEGSRFRLGARTTLVFHQKLRFNGYAAYGIKDDDFKYGGGFQYFFSKDKRLSIEAQYKHDYEMLGKNENALNVDNILTSLLNKRQLSKLNMRDNIYFQLDKELGAGFTNSINFSVSKISASKYVPFFSADSVIVPAVRTTEISLNTRFAGNERTIMGDYEKFRLGGSTPVINLKVTAGIKGLLEGDYKYVRLNLNINDKLYTPPIGYMSYFVQGGWIFGNMPFPLMKIHEGNETYVFNTYAYNLMNYQEFVSDRYASLSLEHHFQGLFLNRIPLLRKLQLREVVGGRFLIGEADKNKHNQLLFPSTMSPLNGKPYAEVSVGVENIIKFLRIDAVWRLTDTKLDNVSKFMLMFSLQIIF